MATAVGYDRERLTVGIQNPSVGGTLTPDLSFGQTWIVQMPAGNVTIADPINMLPGDILTFVIVQDGVGTRLVIWGSAFKKLITLSTLANSRDSVTYRFDGSNWNQIGSVLAIA